MRPLRQRRNNHAPPDPINNAGRTGGRRRSRLRLLLVAAAAVAVFGAASRAANAAVTASFSPGSGTLTVFGDSLNNTITISRDPAGKLLVNNGATAVKATTSRSRAWASTP